MIHLHSGTQPGDAVIAVRNGLAKYCRAMDRMDDELALSLFAPNATVSYRPNMFIGAARDFVPWVHAVHDALAGTVHRIAEPLVDVNVINGTALSEVSGHIMLVEREGRVRHAYGRYVDRWVRSDEEWFIVERHYERDVTFSLVAEDVDVGPGHRDSSDFSYALWDAHLR